MMLGITLSALAVMGIAAAFRKKRPARQPAAYDNCGVQRKDLVFYLILAVLAFWASLGPNWGLYYGFICWCPVLTICGFRPVWPSWSPGLGHAGGLRGRRAERRLEHKPWARSVSFILCALVILEAWHAPLPLINLWRETPPVYEHLAKMPDSTVLYEIPSFDQKRDVPGRRYLYWSTKHGRTLINGYSGYFPEYYRELSRIAAKLDLERLLPRLRELGATHLLWHRKGVPGQRPPGHIQAAY